MTQPQHRPATPINLLNQHRNPHHHPTSPTLENTTSRSSQTPKWITGISCDLVRVAECLDGADFHKFGM